MNLFIGPRVWFKINNCLVASLLAHDLHGAVLQKFQRVNK